MQVDDSINKIDSYLQRYENEIKQNQINKLNSGDADESNRSPGRPHQKSYFIKTEKNKDPKFQTKYKQKK